jgi:hypothetical protein
MVSTQILYILGKGVLLTPFPAAMSVNIVFLLLASALLRMSR